MILSVNNKSYLDPSYLANVISPTRSVYIILSKISVLVAGFLGIYFTCLISIYILEKKVIKLYY